ncbi:MAG TPA: hypothetical protein VN720_07260 [Rudaea sp.]|nr:hypothetical protein [Rudaea sp.]
MNEFLQRLRERKLGQWALAYAAAAWVLLQVLSLLTATYEWPPAAMRVAVAVAVLGVLVVLVLAWYHGERGAQKVSGTELLILSLLLLIGGVILWRVAPGVGASSHAADEQHLPVSAALGQTPVDRKSIAVLPFTDLSPGHDQEYFSDGMAEEILNALAQVRDLKVAGRTSSFHFKGLNEDMRTIGGILGVANVLEGSVRKQGDRVRITAQLIQASDGFHLWSSTYDGDLKDVFELQERIARTITEQLQVILAGEQKTRLVPVATTSPEAHELYLQATAVFNHRDGARMADAIAKLQQAIRLDPKFARAHARLASLAAIISAYADVDQGQSLAMAEHEANIAIELDPALGEPHAALGTIFDYRRQWLAARTEAERATALDPADPNAVFWLGLDFADGGYITEAVAMIDRALAIDPLLPNALAWRAFYHFNAGDRENARRAAQLSMDQGMLAAERNIALVSHAEGRDADAVAQFARGAQASLAGFPENASVILAEGFFGDAKAKARGVAMVDEYLASHPKYVSHAAPWSLLLLGQPARALALAQQPQTINDTLFLNWLWSPWGEPARKLPQFAEFVRKSGLNELWDQRGPPEGCRRGASGDYACD